MLNALPGFNLYAHCYSRCEAICSLQYMKRSIMLISIHGMKL